MTIFISEEKVYAISLRNFSEEGSRGDQDLLPSRRQILAMTASQMLPDGNYWCSDVAAEWRGGFWVAHIVDGHVGFRVKDESCLARNINFTLKPTNIKKSNGDLLLIGHRRDESGRESLVYAYPFMQKDGNPFLTNFQEAKKTVKNAGLLIPTEEHRVMLYANALEHKLFLPNMFYWLLNEKEITQGGLKYSNPLPFSNPEKKSKASIIGIKEIFQ